MLNKKLILILVFFFFGVVISTAYHQIKISKLNKEIKSKEMESDNLKSQINDLSKLYRNPITPTTNPKALTYRKKGGEDYTLDCYDFENKKPDQSLIANINKSLEKDEKVSYLCKNNTLKQDSFITQKEINKGGGGRPGVTQFKIKLYDELSNSIDEIKVRSGSYLDGWCGKILGWSDASNIYYQCGYGDGPLAGSTEYEINILTKEEGIIKSCNYFNGSEKCSSFCSDNSMCQNGFFCNLENNSCVRYCDENKLCPDGGYDSCKAYGPVMGCSNY